MCRIIPCIIPNTNKKVCFFIEQTLFCHPFKEIVLVIIAEVAHLVEHDLAKVGVAGSSPVFRSKQSRPVSAGIFGLFTRVVELR